ncbi:MAG: sulfotransferase, partial [Desulfoplanes sp.]
EILNKYDEWDCRVRAATLDGYEGHIVYESYNDWLIDQRAERKKKGLWSDENVPSNVYPLGAPEEELIMGQRAWTKWKKHFSIKREYNGKLAL